MNPNPTSKTAAIANNQSARYARAKARDDKIEVQSLLEESEVPDKKMTNQFLIKSEVPDEIVVNQFLLKTEVPDEIVTNDLNEPIIERKIMYVKLCKLIIKINFFLTSI